MKKVLTKGVEGGNIGKLLTGRPCGGGVQESPESQGLQEVAGPSHGGVDTRKFDKIEKKC